MIQFVVGIVLARILTPEEYGVMGILFVIIALLQVFVDSGFSKALIQKQDRTLVDISTVFFFNIGVSIFCYVLLWVASPFIAEFYNNLELSLYIRVVGISLFFNALVAIPITILTIDVNFKSIGRVNFISATVSGVIAIIMAYLDFGIWALVFQTIIRVVIALLVVFFIVSWRPVFMFSATSFKNLFSFGSKLLYSSLLNMVVNNFTSIFIAKLSSVKDLGYYTRGTQFSDVVYGVFSSVLDSVLLPTLSQIQNEQKKLVNVTRKIIKSTAIINIPLFMLLTLLAEPLIKTLLTDKWIMAVPIMQIMCIARMITIISGININVLYAIGRADLALKQQYVKIFVRVVLVSISLKYGIIFIAFAELTSTMIHFFINTYYPGKLLKYGPFNQIKDLLPIIFASLIMMFGVFVAIYFIENNIIKLVLAIFTALPLYFIFIYLFKVQEFITLCTKLKISLIRYKR